MSAHTPGPWRAVRHWHAMETLASLAVKSPHLVSVNVPEGDVIAVDLETAEANARLIAAAPDLLEAVRLLVRWIGPPPTDRHSFDSLREDGWAKAQAAIAKAERA